MKRRERALILWAEGLLATQIAERMGLKASSVRAYIAKERKIGDPRATLRFAAAKKKGSIMSDIVARLRVAFDADDMPTKNIAIRQAADEIERLRAALREIEAQGGPDSNATVRRMARFARAALSQPVKKT